MNNNAIWLASGEEKFSGQISNLKNLKTPEEGGTPEESLKNIGNDLFN